jgi:hemolysin III
MISMMKDPVSSLTHLCFALLAIPCTTLLIYFSAQYGTVWHIVSFAVFGLTLLLLYSASAVYHMLKISEKANRMLKKIDHMMIFILIAGTYTPICLVPLRGAWGLSLMIVVWGMAVAGIVLKAVWIDAPRWLATLIYVIMGWSVVVAFFPLMDAVAPGGIALLVLGGVTYTLGAVIYALKRPKFQLSAFGFHELFHLFVMGGTTFHVIFMFRYVLFI